ncbi:hypothetical protein G4D82_09740 [Flavobacterium sp. CYK-4]|uniref:hypothetical protein n=1 Tax=Flavobacterium lotistagni TaxID=2709660 RepID=UPI00140E283C|nr:hypothetical protein [Flavobacterium lotistagni]NHM07501.1 hypothetical protein [Flavobacterium lotistagni]
MTQEEYDFIAKLNPIHKYYILLYVILFSIIICICLENSTYKFIEAIISICLIIYILLKVNNDNNILLFFEDNVEFRTEKKSYKLNYNSLKEICFYNLPKQRAFVRLIFDNQKYDVDIEMRNGLDFNKNDFIQFAFKKNENILIKESSGFEKIKYFILNGEVKHVNLK